MHKKPTGWARSGAAGALIVLFTHFTWVALVIGQAHAEWLMGAIIVMFFITLNSAGFGAFITVLRAPRHGFLLGLAMAPLAGVMAVISNLAVRMAGVGIDLSGFRGILGLFAVTLLYGLFVAVVGGLIGLWARRRAVQEMQVPPGRQTAAGTQPVSSQPPPVS